MDKKTIAEIIEVYFEYQDILDQYAVEAKTKEGCVSIDLYDNKADAINKAISILGQMKDRSGT